jgi:hypothetical protein
MYYCNYCKKEITDKARIRAFRSCQKTRNQTKIFCNKDGILRTLRDYMLNFSKWREEDIVRSAWRHAEIGRNDLSRSLHN